MFPPHGYHSAALRGTAPRRASVAEYVPHWAASCYDPPATAVATVQRSAVPASAGTAGDSSGELPVAALAERVGDFNMSMDPWERTGAAPQGWAPHLQTVMPVQGYFQLRPHDTTLPSFGGCPTATTGTENEPTHTDARTMGGGGKASPSVSIFSGHLFAQTLVDTAEASLATLRLTMMITYATIVNKGYCFLNVFRSGKLRTYPSATHGVHEVLTNTTCACSANDEELLSSPPMGARIHGLPMMTDCNSLSAIIVALTCRFSVQWRAIYFWQWPSPDKTCRENV